MSGELVLRVRIDAEELSRIDAEIEAFAGREDWSPRLEYQIKLVIEELASNVISYGGASQPASIILTSEPDRVTIEIADDGHPFDPLADAPPPVLDGSVEDRPIGGLGVHLVRTLMDEVRYRREDGLNRLTAVKRREA